MAGMAGHSTSRVGTMKPSNKFRRTGNQSNHSAICILEIYVQKADAERLSRNAKAVSLSGDNTALGLAGIRAAGSSVEATKILAELTE